MNVSSINPLSEAELDEVYERFERYSSMQHPLPWNHVIVGRILATLRIALGGQQTIPHYSADGMFRHWCAPQFCPDITDRMTGPHPNASHGYTCRICGPGQHAGHPPGEGHVLSETPPQPDRIEFGNGSKILIEESDAPLRGATFSYGHLRRDWKNAAQWLRIVAEDAEIIPAHGDDIAITYTQDMSIQWLWPETRDELLAIADDIEASIP